MAMATKQITADKQQLLQFYRTMCMIRRFEDMCAEKYSEGKIGGFLHLYTGEEAVATGAFSAFEPRDIIVTHYRDHGHAIARGLDTKRMMAELFGKATGTSKGKGGSMHIFDASKNFLGGYVIVAAMIPLAVGLAMGSKHKKDGAVTICIFGDGAVFFPNCGSSNSVNWAKPSAIRELTVPSGISRTWAISRSLRFS